jgi:LacI family transcriptional regulator
MAIIFTIDNVCVQRLFVQKKSQFLQSPVKPKKNVLVSLGWYDPRVIEGIGRFAREAGWHLEMRSIFEASPPAGWRGDGLLVNDTAVPRLSKFLAAQMHRQPTVLIGANHLASGFATVQEDNTAIGRLAASHFLERGYRHFAWISLNRGRVERERRTAYEAALAAEGADCHFLEWHHFRGKTPQTWANSRIWLAQKLSVLPKPIAVFALDDLLAIDTVEVCLDAGFRVPDDVAVMGVGNMELACECAQVPISSIDEDARGIAYRAARTLEELMNGQVISRAPIVVPVSGLVLRRSTDTFAVTHSAVAKAHAIMKAQYSRPLVIEGIASDVGVSVRALHYAFQSELRISPAKHLERIRIQVARDLLARKNLKITEVAKMSGFGTPRNLHRAHTREYGVPPVRSPRGLKSKGE